VERCSSLPSGSCREAIFEYTFEEVYDSAIKALSYAQINVEQERKSSGDIFAVRSIYVGGRVDKYYYRIHISELEAEKCAVSVHSKTQGAAKKFGWLSWVFAPAGGFAAFSIAMLPDDPENAIALAGVWLAIFGPVTYFVNAAAAERSTLKWSPSDDEDLDRIISFIRSDLLQK